MTVSRVLRQEPNVSVSTREMVLKAAEKAGFMPFGVLSSQRDGGAELLHSFSGRMFD